MSDFDKVLDTIFKGPDRAVEWIMEHATFSACVVLSVVLVFAIYTAHTLSDQTRATVKEAKLSLSSERAFLAARRAEDECTAQGQAHTTVTEINDFGELKSIEVRCVPRETSGFTKP